MLNIAVFGSGRGSNFGAIVAALKEGRIPNAQVVLVISNNSAAGILDIARENGIPALHISQRQFTTEELYVSKLLSELSDHGADFIALAGYMKRVPVRVIQTYHNRMVNIHPALLPKYGGKGMYGMHVHEAVIAAGDTVSGVTVHMVDEEYDHGAVVLQREVPVLPGDTPETLAARVLQVEHRLYPEALRLFSEGKVIPDRSRVGPTHG
jgi:phosphoribosylglycinamide formyltransferase-1